MEVVSIVMVVIAAAFINVAYRLVVASQFGSVSKAIKQTLPQQKQVRPSRRSPYRATSIICNGNACSEVKRLLNVRFLDLDNRPPTIPLPRCNVGYCSCTYAHHTDRRQDHEDRRAPYTLQSELYERTEKGNRRVTGGGRRKGDLS